MFRFIIVLFTVITTALFGANSTKQKALLALDEIQLLQPLLIPYLTHMKGKVVLDAGCGEGTWTVMAAKNGARVCAIDLQATMIAKATAAVKAAGVEKNVQFYVANVCKFPYTSSTFDQILSFQVAHQLPQLEPHIKEIARTLKRGGQVVLTMPASFDTVFTDGSFLPGQAASKISKLFLHPKRLPSALDGVKGVYRAALVARGKRWELVRNENQLKAGEKLWIKEPSGMREGSFHSEKECLALLKQYGLRIKAVHHPKFESHEERVAYNKDKSVKLGPEYLRSSAFVVIIAEKVKG